jgi:sRNA-binding carbon storage regulator CsrA
MGGLAISRKPGQTVVIESPGFSLVIDVESLSRGQVQLRFCGPQAVRIWRGELFGAIRGFDEYDRLVKEEGTDAAQTPTG